MKKFVSVLLILCSIFSFSSCKSEEIIIDKGEKTKPKSAVLPFSVGLNTNGLEGRDSWFSKWLYNDTKDVLTDEFTYENIKSKGFDHLRLPVCFHDLYSQETQTLDEEEMKKLDEILDLIEKKKLYVMLDFHGWWDVDFNDPKQENKFVTIWGLVAERYKDRSDYVIFELINEPSVADTDVLNVWQRDAILKIRETNPDRLIICATPDGNQPWLLENYHLPLEDENLAVAVHLYNPAEFTHQGCEWANQPEDRVRLTDQHLSTLRWDLEQIDAFQKRTGLPIVLNEFGMNFELAKKEDVTVFIKTITQFCVDHGIPWTLWNYKNGEFAVYRDDEWDMNLLDALYLR